MQIAEIYGSLQGEGLLAGTPSTFVRTSGCNLRCRWCDTPFTSWHPTGEEMSVADILTAVEAVGRRHVVVTGGEPLLLADTIGICRVLRERGHHVTIETAGTVLPARSTIGGIADLMSISPKLSSSGPPEDAPAAWSSRHAATRRRDDVILALMASAPWQLKFVIDDQEDLDEAIGWLAALGLTPSRGPVFLMPQGTTPDALAPTTAWLTEACRHQGFRLAPRHHIAWFGYARGT